MMLQEIVTLSPCCPWNHSLSPDGTQVVCSYQYADGQVFLLPGISRETTFNLSIWGQGVVKLKTFDSCDYAIDWAHSSCPISSSCKRIRGGRRMTYQAFFNGTDLQFQSFKMESNQYNSFTLPIKQHSAMLAFDIEGGDVQVSITNFQVKGQPLDDVIGCSYSKQIKMTRVTMGIQFCRRSPAPQSLCKINGNVLSPDTVLYLMVDGPLSETHKGSFFRLWVSRLKQDEELISVEGAQSDKSYKNSSKIITVEPQSRDTHIIMVKSSELIIVDLNASKTISIIKEPFDRYDFILWVESYRITFSVRKTDLVCDWFQNSENQLSLASSPEQPQIPRDRQTTCFPVHDNRFDNRRRRGSSQQDDHFDFSPPTDEVRQCSPSVKNSGVININNSNRNNNSASSMHRPVTVSPSNMSRDSNNNHFSSNYDVRDFDPVGRSVDNSPYLTPVGSHRHLPIKEGYDEIWRQSQRSQDVNSYLSVQSQNEEVSKPPNSDQSASMRHVSSAPIPCSVPKQSRRNNPFEHSSLINVTKKLSELNLKKCATARDATFLNEGFIDNDVYSYESENKFETFKQTNSPTTIHDDSMVRTCSINNNGQPKVFSQQNNNRSTTNSIFDNNQQSTFEPEMNCTNMVQIPQQFNTGHDLHLDEHNENNSGFSIVESPRRPPNNNNSGENLVRDQSRHMSTNSIAKDSGVRTDRDDNVFLDRSDNVDDDEVSSSWGDYARRQLSAYDRHHQTVTKRLY